MTLLHPLNGPTATTQSKALISDHMFVLSKYITPSKLLRQHSKTSYPIPSYIINQAQSIK